MENKYKSIIITTNGIIKYKCRKIKIPKLTAVLLCSNTQEQSSSSSSSSSPELISSRAA